MSNPALGGGEEVRVCNPCVPDPNYNPPPQNTRQDSWQPSNSYQRPFYNGPSSPMPSMPPNNHTSDDLARLLPNFAQPPQFGPHSGDEHPPGLRADLFRDGRVSFHNPSSVADLFPPPAVNPHRRSVPAAPFGNSTSTSHHHHHSHSGSSRYRDPSYITGLPPTVPGPHLGYVPSQQPASLPAPRRQIPEEDECPICGEELPPKGPDGGEEARESHVQECIATHFSGGQAPRSTEPAATTPPVDIANATALEAPTTGLSDSPNRSTPPSAPSTSAPGPSRPRRMTANRMLVYRATEKDCIGEDGEEQECVIWFEEFIVGDEMGRLECLCKFHRVSWFISLFSKPSIQASNGLGTELYQAVVGHEGHWFMSYSSAS
jgi:hypothetical protein